MKVKDDRSHLSQDELDLLKDIQEATSYEAAIIGRALQFWFDKFYSKYTNHIELCTDEDDIGIEILNDTIRYNCYEDRSWDRYSNEVYIREKYEIPISYLTDPDWEQKHIEVLEEQKRKEEEVKRLNEEEVKRLNEEARKKAKEKREADEYQVYLELKKKFENKG